MFKFDAVNGFQVFVLLRFSFAILTSIAMAKSGISLPAIGIYEALMLIGGTFTFFWMTGLLNGLLSYYPKLERENQRHFVFKLFFLILIMSMAVGYLIWISRGWITTNMTNLSHLPHYEWLCLWIAINLPTFLIEYLYILLNRSRWMVLFGIYSFGGQFLVVITPLLLGYSLEVSFVGLFILAITKFIWLLILLYSEARIHWRFTQLFPYFWIALPIIIYTLVGGVMSYIDGVIIMKYFDESQFAIYRNGARELPLSMALLNAMSAALIPNISTHLTSGLQQIKHRTRNLMYPLFGISIVLMLISEWAYPLVFSADFASSAVIFNIYLLILISRILLPQTILIGLKKTNIILYASITEAMLNLGLSLLLIQPLGLGGVAIATAVAFMVEKLILILYNKYTLNIQLSAYLDIQRYLVCTILLITSFLVWQFVV